MPLFFPLSWQRDLSQPFLSCPYERQFSKYQREEIKSSFSQSLSLPSLFLQVYFLFLPLLKMLSTARKVLLICSVDKWILSTFIGKTVIGNFYPVMREPPLQSAVSNPFSTKCQMVTSCPILPADPPTSKCVPRVMSTLPTSAPQALSTLGLPLAVCTRPHCLPSVHPMACPLSHPGAFTQAISSNFSLG